MLQPWTKRLWAWGSDQFGQTIIHPQYFIKKAEYSTVFGLAKASYEVFLDIGCGRQWYRGIIEPKVKEYLALDYPKTAQIYQSSYPVEIKADAHQIPLKDQTVDLALMIMVLEHLKDPERALKEVNRVLKKNGQFLLCTVENYPGHDLPNNYYHFTKFGLEEILKRNGFKIKNIKSFGNFWQTQVVWQNVYIMQFIKGLTSRKSTLVAGILVLLLLAPLMILGNIFALVFSSKKIKEEFALAHVVTCSKAVK
jgi:SAM-dependent methyltransferase